MQPFNQVSNLKFLNLTIRTYFFMFSCARKPFPYETLRGRNPENHFPGKTLESARPNVDREGLGGQGQQRKENGNISAFDNSAFEMSK